MERQGRDPIEWDLQRNLPAPTPTPASPSQDQELQTDRADVTNRPPRVLPGPSIPAPQPLWHQDLHHTGWSRHSMHRPEIVSSFDIYNHAVLTLSKHVRIMLLIPIGGIFWSMMSIET